MCHLMPEIPQCLWMSWHVTKSQLQHAISIHGYHLGWNEDRKRNLGQLCSYFRHLICLFSELNAAHKALLRTDVSSHCSELAVFYLLRNLLSLLMRLIKLAQSLFNEAPAARSTGRTTAVKTDQSRPRGTKLLNGFLKRGFKRLNQSKAVIIHLMTKERGTLRDEGMSCVISLWVI